MRILLALLPLALSAQSLFNGKTLGGWEARSTSVAGKNGDWRVEDGAITCPGTSPGWLSTEEVFDDFHLTLEFKGSATVNSGVFLRSEREGQPHVTGYELQIWDFQPAGYLTGSLVGSVKAQPTQILADRWNKYEITAKGPHFLIRLNGKTVLEAADIKHQIGVLGLQCQKDNPIQFRNIRVRRLRRP